ncbi:MAG: aspartate ammonia-lyase [Candidatus Micrarchaeaceae archaeon]
MKPKYRKERDALGLVDVPYGSYYGSETARAISNFKISGFRVPTEFIHAYAQLKEAAAIANAKLGKLDGKIAKAIEGAAREVAAGKLDEYFILDVFQAGAGTSTNMNLNEVIANRALELMGKRKGEYKYINPNDHVNMSQSTNDTFHVAMHIASVELIKSSLLPALSVFEKTLEAKAREFSKIVKIGRTHLQDAVPITLGDEFEGYSGQIAECIKNLTYASSLLRHIPIGGTAVGTGMNAPKGYPRLAASKLSDITGIRFMPETNLFAGMQNMKKELMLSGVLRMCAVTLNRIANDFRLLGSGPRAGIGELVLPAVQPGSSIMPGKVNPSMAEALNMACFQVMGSCTTIEEAANSGQLELNVFMPVAAFNIVFAIKVLSKAIIAFNDKCVRGTSANDKRIKRMLDENISLATALSPYIGYAKAAEIANDAASTGKTIMQVCLERKVLDKAALEKLLDSKNLI